ncbi:MAG TPA: hypothetical protein VIH61_07960 [Waddliaceae bacterium]
MIFNKEFQKVISNVGWVDKGNLWVYDCATDTQSLYYLCNADYLTIKPGIGPYFSVSHVFGSKITISVHSFGEPNKILCSATFNNFQITQEGELSHFDYVPKYYVAGFSINSEFEFNLVTLEEGRITIDNDKIRWYKDGDFDFMYQGLISVTEYEGKLIFSVQRSGMLFIYDLKKDTLTNTVQLAGRSGNPEIIVTEEGIIASDYDTVLLLDGSGWKTIRTKLLQQSAERTAQFIGQISRGSNDNECLYTIARPFSGDIVAINNNFNVRRRCKTGRQPLEATLTNDHNLIARDWQTGTLLKGVMKRKLFGKFL